MDTDETGGTSINSEQTSPTSSRRSRPSSGRRRRSAGLDGSRRRRAPHPVRGTMAADGVGGRALRASGSTTWSPGPRGRTASTPDEVVAALRAMVGGRRRPPGTAVADPLMDALVHGQDIAIPLGVERRMPTEGRRRSPRIGCGRWGSRSTPVSAFPGVESSPTTRTSASAQESGSRGVDVGHPAGTGRPHGRTRRFVGPGARSGIRRLTSAGIDAGRRTFMTLTADLA